MSKSKATYRHWLSKKLILLEIEMLSLNPSLSKKAKLG